MAKTRILNLGIGHPEQFLHEVKYQIAKNLRAFARNGFPMKHRLGGRDLWIDVDSLTNAILIQGTVPNAAEIKGFSAPVAKRVQTKGHPVQMTYGWRTVKTRAKTGPAGAPLRSVEYWGGRTIDNALGVFAVKKDGKPRAYGLDAEGALPAYYYVSVPEWMMDEQGTEVQRIVEDTIQDCLNAVLAA